MKKFLSIMLALAMVLALVACGAETAPATEAAPAATEAAPVETAAPAEQVGAGKVVGIAMPTQSSERWINDGANMKKQLEAKGYEVILQYAEDDVQMQVSQIENMVAQQVDCLVIASIDSVALTGVEAQAKEAGIPVIAYDRLLMQTDAVSYYASFDNEGVGRAIAEYVEKKLDLANTTETYTIEFFMGSPDDNNAVLLYNGIMKVIQKYLDNGTLVCKSSQVAFADNCTLRWSQETAQKRCEDILAGFYADEDLDICMTAYDGLAYGCRSALEGAGYTAENWPLITGQDAELMAVKNIIGGYQTMSIAKDTRTLAEKCVTMVDAVLTGSEPEINDTTTYDNGVFVVPSYLCTPVAVDAENYAEVLIETGYYTAEQVNG